METVEVLVRIPKDLYEGIECRNGELETEYVCDELMKAVDNGTPLPDNATNGDVIQTMYSHYTFKIESFEGFVRCSYDGWYIRLPICWWNAPYKAGDTE